MSEDAAAVHRAETLVLEREFTAPVERVFDAWTRPELLAQWFGPEEFVVDRTDLDLRIGGEYEIVIRSPAGDVIRHFGSYLDISEPVRLVFTWVLENQACQGSDGQHAETIVTIDLTTTDNGGTRLCLQHEKLPDRAAYAGHEFGWRCSLDALAARLDRHSV